MLNLAPTHIKDYCFIDNSDIVYNKIFTDFDAKHIAIYKIKCSCGNLNFNVYKDPNPTVKLICAKCGTEIIVYDLIYYSAAIKYPHLKDKFEMFTDDGNKEFEVYTLYEYPDPNFPEEFGGENDVNWCYVFLKSREKIIEFLNDETA